MSKDYVSTNRNIISNWGNILFDTTVVIKSLDYKKRSSPVNEFCFRLVKYLSESQYQKSASTNADRKFNISALTIAEILEYSGNTSSKSKRIVQALNANNLTILDFDEEVANVFNTSFCDKLGQKAQKDVLLRWGESNSKDNRQALNNDLMILASGVYVEVDSVLCFDKGMYRIGRECDLNMIYVDEKYFDYNEKYFFTFHRDKADKDLLFDSRDVKVINPVQIISP